MNHAGILLASSGSGTGKTTTLVEAIFETLRRESQVLVCAQSNMAVDWISERLVDRGIEVLRVGNPTRVNDKMLAFTYERRFEAHPDYPKLWAMRKAVREMQGRRRRGEAGYHDKLDRLKSRATQLEFTINNDLMASARVIACTLAWPMTRSMLLNRSICSSRSGRLRWMLLFFCSSLQAASETVRPKPARRSCWAAMQS